MQCEFTAIASVDVALENITLAVNATVDVSGCDSYKFAPIGHVAAPIYNLTITGKIVVTNINTGASMKFSNFINTFDDQTLITDCKSSLYYELYTS